MAKRRNTLRFSPDGLRAGNRTDNVREDTRQIGQGDAGLSRPLPLDWTRVIPLFLVLAGVLVYLNSLTGAFVFDDHKLLRQLEPLDGWTEILPWLFTTRRVMLYLTLVMNYAIDGDNVVGYHLLNMTVHITAALALFGIVRQTLIRQVPGYSAALTAFTIALIWLVHPLNTQAVTYIVQRSESMMGMFYLLVMYCAIRLIDRPNHPGWLAAAFVCCLLGMLSKEVMITAPVMVMVYDWVFLRRPAQRILAERGRLYLMLMATWVVYPVLGMELFVEGKAAGFGYETLAWWQYALTQPLVILKYLRLAVWPHPLIFDYSHYAQHTRFEVESVPEAVWNITWPILLVLLLFVLSAWRVWRRHPLGFIGAWFFITLSITSSVLKIADLMVEHRMYLPSAAVVTLVVMVGRWLCSKSVGPAGVRLIAPLSVACVVVSFSFLTVRRNTEYQSKVALWHTVTKHQPRNPRGWHNLGAAYDKLAQKAQGPRQRRQLADIALKYWERTIKISPSHDEAHNGIGTIWLELGSLDMAMQRFQRAIELVPEDPEYQHNLGEIYLRRGELEKAVEQYRKAISLRPTYAKAHNNLGVATMRQANFEEAIQLFEKAVQYDDELADAHFNLGKAYRDAGQPSRGLSSLRRAVELQPGVLQRELVLAGSLLQLGRSAAALAEYRSMQQRFPNDPEATRQLAWVLAIHPDERIRNGAEACTLAEQANRVTGGRNPLFIRTLAAAYAEFGRFDAAAQLMDQIIAKLVDADADHAAIDSLRQEAQRYRDGKPLRVDPTTVSQTRDPVRSDWLP